MRGEQPSAISTLAIVPLPRVASRASVRRTCISGARRGRVGPGFLQDPGTRFSICFSSTSHNSNFGTDPGQRRSCRTTPAPEQRPSNRVYFQGSPRPIDRQADDGRGLADLSRAGRLQDVACILGESSGGKVLRSPSSCKKDSRPYIIRGIRPEARRWAKCSSAPLRAEAPLEQRARLRRAAHEHRRRTCLEAEQAECTADGACGVDARASPSRDVASSSARALH